MLLFIWALHLDRTHPVNVSYILYGCLRWDPEIKHLNRLDSNRVMLEVFKNKEYASKGIQSMGRILDKFTERLMALKQRERYQKIYTTENKQYDDWINDTLTVMNRDLKDAYKAIKPLVRRDSISNSSLWFIINETASLAVANGVRWIDYLTKNALIERLSWRGQKMSIHEYLLNCDIGFSEALYLKEIERKKDRDLNNALNRQSLQNFQNFTQTITNNGVRKSHKQRGKKKGNPSIKQIFKDIEMYTSKMGPNTKWDKAWCIFYNHPSAKCRNGNNCDRKHTCFACGGDHPISDCKSLNKPKKRD